MKVCAPPDEVPWSEPDYANYDPAKEARREEEHRIALKEWLIKAGYDGKYTGEILSEPMADGYANYMMADKGRSSFLVHLPYGDAWDSRNVEFLPRAEVIKRIERKKNWAKIPDIRLNPNFGKAS